MKRYIIALIGLLLVVVLITGCSWGIGGPSDCMGVGGTFTSNILVSIRDKQTGQPIPHAGIHIVRSEVFQYQAGNTCDQVSNIVETISTETDINGLFSFSYTYTTNYYGDVTILSINVAADHYGPVETYVQAKPGMNEINLRMLNTLNQP